MSFKGNITKMKFRESLGVLGLENASYLADRVFSIIDEDNDGLVSFEEFLSYMNILIKGDENEKALLSFRILDTGHKGKIVYEDIEKMLFGICLLWNSITGSKIVPKKQYIDYIFKSLDAKGCSEILFKEFLVNIFI
jgi:1-phosphatidylinositol-4-phosphate 5-kinase